MTIRLAKISRNQDPRSLGPSEFYIGRTFNGWIGSPLGNPYSVQDYGRIEAVNLYRVWLQHEVPEKASNPRVLMVLKAMRDRAVEGDITLWCWCAPNLCHGEVIREAIESWEF